MKNVHKLTEGAILLAIYSVLLLLTLYIPVLGVVTNLFLAVPFIFYAARNEWKHTVVFFIASVFLSLIFGTILSIPITFAYGLTGAVMGYLIKKNKSRTVIFSASSLVFLMNLIVQYAVAVAFFQFNFIKEMLTLFQESINTSVEMLQRLGQTPDEKAIEQFKASIEMVETIMPSLFVISSFAIVFIIQLVSLPIIKRFGINVSHWKPFRELTLPKSLLWYYLIALVAGLILKPEEGTYWFWALINLVYILQLFMVVQGLSFVYYFSYEKGISKAFPIIVTISVLLVPVVLYIVRIIGIIDLGFDLRKRIEKK